MDSERSSVYESCNHTRKFISSYCADLALAAFKEESMILEGTINFEPQCYILLYSKMGVRYCLSHLARWNCEVETSLQANFDGPA